MSASDSCENQTGIFFSKWRKLRSDDNIKVIELTLSKGYCINNLYLFYLSLNCQGKNNLKEGSCGGEEIFKISLLSETVSTEFPQKTIENK